MPKKCDACEPLTCKTHGTKLRGNVERLRLDLQILQATLRNEEEKYLRFTRFHAALPAQATHERVKLAEFDHETIKTGTHKGERACDMGAELLRRAGLRIELVHRSTPGVPCKVFQILPIPAEA